MRILVSGATGFVGRNLVPELLNASHTILTVNREICKAQEIFGDCNNCKHIQLSQHDEIVNFSPEIVIHLASYVTSSNEASIIDSLLDANIVFGVKLLDTLKRCGELKLFINTGSFAEYAMGVESVNNAYLYTASKSAFRQFLEYYSNLCNYSYLHLVPFSIYGGVDSQKKIMDYLKDSFDAIEPVKMSGGAQILDFVYIKDVVSYYLFVVENYKRFSELGTKTFYVGSGRGTSIKELSTILEAKYNKKCNVAWGALSYREMDVMYAVAPQAENIKLGWRPNYSLEDTL